MFSRKSSSLFSQCQVKSFVPGQLRRNYSLTNEIPKATLYNGNKIPLLLLGTWKSHPSETANAVEAAVNSGYIGIDCANDYNNENIVGDTLQKLFQKGVVKRDDLFIQCKLWNTNHRPKHVSEDLMATLKDLHLEYVDAFLIHWPQASPSTGKSATTRESGAYPANYKENTMFPVDDKGFFTSDKESHYLETWRAMEDLVDKGLVLNIGLSNFNRRQVQEVMKNASKYRPAILQNECHPYLQQKDLIDFAKINDIQFQAFSPLGSGSTHLGVEPPPNGLIPLDHPIIKQLALMYRKSPAQIMLKWNIQRGVSVVAKSRTPERIKDNMAIFDFEISSDHMKMFDQINYGWRHLLWRETSNHADYPFKDELPYNYQLEKAPLESSSGTKSKKK